MGDKNVENQKILEETLNNTTSKVKYESQDFIILIKKQEGKSFCTFFLVDCCDNIWI